MCVLALALSAVLLGVSAGSSYAATVNSSSLNAQVEIADEGSVVVETAADGRAVIKIAIGQAGVYSVYGYDSAAVDCDTIGFLYDSDGELVSQNDDSAASADFSICVPLKAGVYYLECGGKDHQAGAALAVGVEKSTRVSTLDLRYQFGAGGVLEKLELGSWSHGSGASAWHAVDSSSYSIVGYCDRQVFVHAAQNGAVDRIKWNSDVNWTIGSTCPYGSYVVRLDAAGANPSYSGTGYFFVENPCTDESDGQYYRFDLSRQDAQVSYKACGGVSGVSLGWRAVESPNRNTYWTAISNACFSIAGYVSCDVLEEAGNPDEVTWVDGLPAADGEFVIKLVSTGKRDSDGARYFGTRLVWVDLENVHHVGSGSWVVDVAPTYKSSGSAHLNCMYCGNPCDETELAPETGAKSGTSVTAGAGAAKAVYRVGKGGTVAYVASKAKSSAKTVTVPAMVEINGETYSVTGISAGAFKGSRATTVTVKATALTKKSVKNALKGSKVKTVKVPKAKKAAYKKVFAKSNSGKKATVK